VAQKLEDSQSALPSRPDRRQAHDGRLYSKDEFLAHYGDELGETRWEEAPIGEEFDWDEDPAGVVGLTLWPRESPKRMVVTAEGDIAFAAVSSTCGDVVEELFATLLRVRQAEFASKAGFPDSNAWNIGAVEPDVPIDIHRTLKEHEFESAWGRWRKQWQNNITLTDKQTWDKKNLPVWKFNKKMRTAFNAFVKNFMGEPHVAKFIIRNGVGPENDTLMLVALQEEIVKTKQERSKHEEEETHGAEEPVWKLRRKAYHARQELREGRRLAKRNYTSLNYRAQTLVDEYLNGALNVAVDKSNKAFGHGIARTNDFGYAAGQNMCKQIPTDVSAALRILKSKEPR